MMTPKTLSQACLAIIAASVQSFPPLLPYMMPLAPLFLSASFINSTLFSSSNF